MDSDSRIRTSAYDVTRTLATDDTLVRARPGPTTASARRLATPSSTTASAGRTPWRGGSKIDQLTTPSSTLPLARRPSANEAAGLRRAGAGTGKRRAGATNDIGHSVETFHPPSSHDIDPCVGVVTVRRQASRAAKEAPGRLIQTAPTKGEQRHTECKPFGRRPCRLHGGEGWGLGMRSPDSCIPLRFRNGLTSPSTWIFDSPLLPGNGVGGGHDGSYLDLLRCYETT